MYIPQGGHMGSGRFKWICKMNNFQGSRTRLFTPDKPRLFTFPVVFRRSNSMRNNMAFIMSLVKSSSQVWIWKCRHFTCTPANMKFSCTQYFTFSKLEKTCLGKIQCKPMANLMKIKKSVKSILSADNSKWNSSPSVQHFGLIYSAGGLPISCGSIQFTFHLKLIPCEWENFGKYSTRECEIHMDKPICFYLTSITVEVWPGSKPYPIRRVSRSDSSSNSRTLILRNASDGPKKVMNTCDGAVWYWHRSTNTQNTEIYTIFALYRSGRLGAFTAKSGRKHYNPPPLTVMWMNFDSPNFPSLCSLSAIISFQTCSNKCIYMYFHFINVSRSNIKR